MSRVQLVDPSVTSQSTALGLAETVTRVSIGSNQPWRSGLVLGLGLDPRQGLADQGGLGRPPIISSSSSARLEAPIGTD